MASSGSNISPEALRNFRHHYFVTHWGKKVLFLIYNLSFLHGQHKTIYEILSGNGVRLTKKGPFNPQEIKNLTDRPPEALDVTLLNKICQTLWQKRVNDPGDELKKLVKKIKDERNFVSHEAPDLSDTDLEKKLKDFQAMLKETLDKTKCYFPCHSCEIDQLNAEIKVAVTDLLRKIREKYDPSNSEDVRNLKDEMAEFWSVFSEDIQNFSREEFLSLYGRLCQILPFDWLVQYGIMDPCTIMIPLKMELDKEFHGCRQGNEGIIVDQTDILTAQGPMGTNPEVVIISGDAGSGKTTILCSIVEKWHKKIVDMTGLSSFQTLLYMQFRNHSHDNFDAYLQSLVPQTVSRYSISQVKSSVISSKCLVLCDGYDEGNENSEKLFEEILTLSSKHMKIVVTTRPGNTQRLTDIVNKGQRSRLNLKVLGLQKNDLNSLTEKLIGQLMKDDAILQEEMKRELFEKIKGMNTGTNVILQTPLYFNLFILLYIECPDLRNEISTRTSLYLQLKKHMTKRISNKIGISTESLKEFDALYRKWSLKHYSENKYEWSETDVISLKQEISCQELFQNFDAIMSSHFCIKYTKKQLEIEKVFCHRHRSEQEFTVASSICDDIIKASRMQQEGNIILDVMQSKGLLDVEDGMKKSHQFSKLKDIISYIPGILHSSEKDVLYKIINNIHEICVSYCVPFETYDELLVPCIETRLDKKILKSLIELMKKTPEMNDITFKRTDSLLVLPSLLSKLRPGNIRFRDIPINHSELDKTLKKSNRHSIHTEFWQNIFLENYAEQSGLALQPVDMLRLRVYYDADTQLESLRRISLIRSAKELKLSYFMEHVAEDCIAQIINRTFPTNLAEGTTELQISLSEGCDIKNLLQSLTVRPLKSITLVIETESDADEPMDSEACSDDSTDTDVDYSELIGSESDSDYSFPMHIEVDEDLKTLCMANGLGELFIVSH
ncbi:uncharacterized protein LOC135206305 [Macrobrachium nipponense]|uniref:uncharacterized protein LOC135206305 n=1 Tax=Macrobrachium nipponense TaxID=159736 RepID=UPI0030C81314